MPLADFLGQYLPRIEDEMRAVVSSGDASLAEYYEMLFYHLGWSEHGQGPAATGKRIRPALTLLVCAAAGGDPATALPAAAAVELLHNFTLIHDDIQDESAERRGRPSVWTLWGRAQAINAGDAMFTLAHLALQRLAARGHPAEIGLEALNLLDQTCLRLTRGQHLDMAFEQRESVTVAEYNQMIEGKTAALIATAAELGALCASASPTVREHYRAYARNLGLAFQAYDDLLGIWGDSALTGKSSASDIETRKKSLPVVFGLENSADLRRLYATAERDGGGAVVTIVGALEAVGARAFVEQEAHRLSLTALDHLEQAQPQTEAGDSLRALTLQLLARQS